MPTATALASAPFDRLRAIHARLAALTASSGPGGGGMRRTTNAPAALAAAASASPAAARTPGGVAGQGAPPQLGAGSAPPLTSSAWLEAPGPLQQVLVRQRQRDMQRRILAANPQPSGEAAAGGGSGSGTAVLPPSVLAAQRARRALAASAADGGAAAASPGPARSTGAAPSLGGLQRMVREGSPERRLKRLRLLQQLQQQQRIAAEQAAAGGLAAPAGEAAAPAAGQGSPTATLRLARLLHAAAPANGSGSALGGAGGRGPLQQQVDAGLAAAQRLAMRAQHATPAAGSVSERLRLLTQQLQACALELRAAEGDGGGSGR
jgi:hypothetical protein